MFMKQSLKVFTYIKTNISYFQNTTLVFLVQIVRFTHTYLSFCLNGQDKRIFAITTSIVIYRAKQMITVCKTTQSVPKHTWFV